MAQIVLNLKGFTEPEIAGQLRAKAQVLTENAASFPAASPTAAQLTAAADDIDGTLADAATKTQAAKTATGIKDTAVEAGRQALRELATYCTQKKLAADVVELLFNFKKTPVPVTSLAQVLGLAATFGDKPGEIDLIWQPVEKAKGYQVQWRLAGTAGTWTMAKSPSASKTTVKGLPSGQTVEIQVRAIGSKELEGPWSDAATHLVP